MHRKRSNQTDSIWREHREKTPKVNPFGRRTPRETERTINLFASSRASGRSSEASDAPSELRVLGLRDLVDHELVGDAAQRGALGQRLEPAGLKDRRGLRAVHPRRRRADRARTRKPPHPRRELYRLP